MYANSSNRTSGVADDEWRMRTEGHDDVLVYDGGVHAAADRLCRFERIFSFAALCDSRERVIAIPAGEIRQGGRKEWQLLGAGAAAYSLAPMPSASASAPLLPNASPISSAGVSIPGDHNSTLISSSKW